MSKKYYANNEHNDINDNPDKHAFTQEIRTSNANIMADDSSVPKDGPPDVGILSRSFDSEQGITTTSTVDAQQQLLTSDCPIEDTINCLNGIVNTTHTCEEACNGHCCIDEDSDACHKFTGKVCKDDVSCIGYAACAGATINAVVRGCNGYKACYYVAGAEDDAGTIGTINNSCFGNQACYSLGYEGGTVWSIISSCNGTNSCYYMAAYGGAVGSVSDSCFGNSACAWTSACQYLECGSNIDEILDSCEGRESCYGAAYESGNIYYGILDACNAFSACFYAGRDGYTNGAIPSGVRDCCNSANACINVTEATLPDTCTRASTASP